MDGAFLIYNPITGETSAWVEINRKPGKRNHLAFGFDPQSDEHKVIWISGSVEYHFRESILERPKDQVVEVFTVGKNTWRRIDATPPISITYEDSFYVDGCLYWRFRETEHGELEQIMRFDIVTEKFRVIPIPGFVIHTKEYKWSQTVDLTEIDGRIAVLTQTSLWTFHEEVDGDIRWTEEKINIPCDWNGKPELSIEALTGTNLILLRTEWSDSIFYFNRNTKESIRFPISPDCSSWDWDRIGQV
ncbi:F-box/kelch-repeat protein At3g06240-like [Papaver somniferum]|uniref:F-box/kelch-repeat protein At3g06240-like n=1 Tax=Papaver somniferum TaxID=3469 RepID=UPI000E6F6A89|nr:F-box/kelch-repeat protein At3g06240-like [Papaver somniferum]